MNYKPGCIVYLRNHIEVTVFTWHYKIDDEGKLIRVGEFRKLVLVIEFPGWNGKCQYFVSDTAEGTCQVREVERLNKTIDVYQQSVKKQVAVNQQQAA